MKSLKTFVGLLAVMAFAGHAKAATLTVTSLADDGGAGTLRALINGAMDGDVIMVPAGTITLTTAGATAAGDADEALGDADLDITVNLTIIGAGSGQTIIDGDGTTTLDNVFTVDSAGRSGPFICSRTPCSRALAGVKRAFQAA